MAKVLTFLERNGQDLLSSICTHYRIDFCGDVGGVGQHSREQLAHSAIFNPALAKSKVGWLPKMLRDISGVSECRMTFLKNDVGIYRSVRVVARLNDELFAAQCRCCSYCGSCFSGRFMKGDGAHQQAGGWKEITERTAAGQHSWASLRGWRLCVPCFSHWASKGTHVNASRQFIEELLHWHKDFLTSEYLPGASAQLHPERAAPGNALSAVGDRDHASAHPHPGPELAAPSTAMDERDVESDTSGDDFLSGAERTPTPNAAAKEEDAEPPLKDAQTATVEDAVHVLLSISTSLAMNDAAHDLLSMRAAAFLEMRPVPTPEISASTATGKATLPVPGKDRVARVQRVEAALRHLKPKQQQQQQQQQQQHVCRLCSKVFKTPNACFGHLKHCMRNKRSAMADTANGARKRPLHQSPHSATPLERDSKAQKGADLWSRHGVGIRHGDDEHLASPIRFPGLASRSDDDGMTERQLATVGGLSSALQEGDELCQTPKPVRKAAQRARSERWMLAQSSARGDTSNASRVSGMSVYVWCICRSLLCV